MQNIRCKGENGIFLSGSSDNYIEDIQFQNIKIVLQKSSKWEIDGYDIRPCPGDGNIKRKISGVYCNFSKNIVFTGLRIEKEESILEYYNQDVTLLDVTNVTVR
jgi:hypothetical protein